MAFNQQCLTALDQLYGISPASKLEEGTTKSTWHNG